MTRDKAKAPRTAARRLICYKCQYRMDVTKKEDKPRCPKCTWIMKELVPLNAEQQERFEKNIAWVYSRINWWCRRSEWLIPCVGVDDLVSGAFLGLANACKKYDPKFGTQFSTYLTYWIDQSVRVAIMNYNKHGFTNIGDQRASVVPLDAHCTEVDGPIHEIIHDSFNIDDELEHLDNAHLYKTYMAMMSKKERDIFWRRYHLKLTLEDIGNVWRISKERVRQIMKGAIQRIRTQTGMEEPQEPEPVKLYGQFGICDSCRQYGKFYSRYMPLCATCSRTYAKIYGRGWRKLLKERKSA